MSTFAPRNGIMPWIDVQLNANYQSRLGADSGFERPLAYVIIEVIPQTVKEHRASELRGLSRAVSTPL
jgi:hypothetical protein